MGREQVGKSLKWSTALCGGGDPCLFVVPGSHTRYRTPAERVGLVEEPTQPIESELQLNLRRGQTAFWAGTLIHRGWQPPGCEERLSMTCGLQAHGRDDVPLHEAHQWKWCQAPNIGPTLEPRMRGYWERWLEACDGGAQAEKMRAEARL